MPRGRRPSSAPRLSAGQAQYVLERLVGDRRVSARDVNRYLGDMHREISLLENRLASLRSAAGGGGVSRAPRAAARRGRSRITAEQRASRQLQGRYLGLIRQIPASQRGRFAKIARERGREAAIREMQTALK